jgi:hypothetical protein
MNDEDFLALQKGIAAANVQDITFKQIASKKTSKLKREWIGLTRDEMVKIYGDTKNSIGFYSLEKYVLAVETLLKVKNT